MLAWRSDGSDTAPPVVLLHGLAETMRCWDRVAPLLADRFRVVLADLPGFGGSPGGGRGATIEDHAAAVAEALREAGVGDAVVAGHSLGGAVAVALAEREPGTAARIVLVATPPTYDSRLSSRKGTERMVRLPVVGPLMWRAMPESRAREGLRTAFAPGAEVPAQFVADLRATSWAAFAGATTALDDYLAARGIGERVAALGLPVTVVSGEQDQRVDPASLAVYDQAPEATVHRLPGAGHTPLWESPERTADLIAGDRGQEGDCRGTD